ncbi:MAG TPA: glycosyltransferase [Chloroflexaceae bacterium]|nr:glycosyltransferase [Chloroflexaceae bacterium]
MLTEQTPRVGYVLKVYPRFSETFIVNEILAHEAAGAELEIFALRHPTEGRFHEQLARVRAPVTYLPSQGLRAADLWAQVRAAAQDPAFWERFAPARYEDVHDVAQALALAELVRRRGITHLHAHFASVATSVARLAARLAGVTYSFTAHAKDLYHESVDPDDLRRKLADASAVVTVSDYNLAHLREQFGEDAAGVRRIYNGLDLAHFPYSAPAARPRRIVAVGRLIEKKGFDVLVDACALLRDRGVELECLIVGAGECGGALAAQIGRLGLEGRVRLLGPRPQGEVAALVRGGAAFAAPCVVGADGNRDGMPTVLLEAMALGTPCVATDVTGIPELIDDGVSGLLVPQRDPAALASALERLLGDAALRLRLATAARRRIEASFDIAHNSAALRAVFAGAARERFVGQEVL